MDTNVHITKLANAVLIVEIVVGRRSANIMEKESASGYVFFFVVVSVVFVQGTLTNDFCCATNAKSKWYK